MKHTVRFRSWSRKGYAMFFSLGRCVTIGCLDKAITEVALKKQKTGITQFLYELNGVKEEMREEHGPDTLEDSFMLLSILVQPQVTMEISCNAIKNRISLIYLRMRVAYG